MGKDSGTQPSTILVVDDRAGLLAPLLEQAGYRVIVATGFEDLPRLGATPDLVLASIAPATVEESLSAVERLKAEPAWQQVPVLVLAQPGVSLDTARALRAGAAEALAAGLPPSELLAPVETHLTIGRLQRELCAINSALEERVAARTRELAAANAALKAEVAERARAEQELRFSNAILETQQAVSLDGILVVDGEGRIISFNQRFVDMWAMPPEVVQSHSDELALAWAIKRLADPAGFLERVRSLYASRDETTHDELVLRTGVTFERYSAPMRGRDGEYLGRVWFFRDITMRKRAETALRESEQRFRRLVDLANEGIWALDADHRTTFVKARRNPRRNKVGASQRHQEDADLDEVVRGHGPPSISAEAPCPEGRLLPGSMEPNLLARFLMDGPMIRGPRNPHKCSWPGHTHARSLETTGLGPGDNAADRAGYSFQANELRHDRLEPLDAATGSASAAGGMPVGVDETGTKAEEGDADAGGTASAAQVFVRSMASTALNTSSICSSVCRARAIFCSMAALFDLDERCADH